MLTADKGRATTRSPFPRSSEKKDQESKLTPVCNTPAAAEPKPVGVYFHIDSLAHMFRARGILHTPTANKSGRLAAIDACVSE